MPSIVTLPLTEDDTPSRTFRITSAGSALNLSSATVVAVIKPTAATEDDAAGTYTLSLGAGLTVVDASAGTVRLDIPAAVTASPGAWFYKIRITLAAQTETAIWGWITISDA